MACRFLFAVALLVAPCFTQDVTTSGGAGGSPGWSPLTVDLGYGVYKGSANSSTALNTWKGIRYAAPPVGPLRWRAPAPPAVNRTVVTASAFGPTCPQSGLAGVGYPFIPGNEDCLFINVYAPAGKSGLPVFIYIHEGGYGIGDGTRDMTDFVNSNDNRFIAVTFQYRLGAFGFLSSSEVKSSGVLNAGLLDQVFAFQWVQTHIAKFGGNPAKVTISGESAGGGSVMLHATAQDGTQGTKYFKNLIAASPYLPSQPNYNDAIVTQHYYAFSQAAGCGSSGSVIACLRGKDSFTLQQASHNASVSPPTPFANWGFIPVTDGSYITGLPSVLLNQKKVNGQRMLVGNNANEGALFTYPGINTQADLTAWAKQNFPRLSNAQIAQVLNAYPSTSTPVNPNDPRFETNGLTPPTAINVSQAGTGHQQRANNIYAEATFVCPSYWMATAFTQLNKAGYHYQYSVPFAGHGSDVAAYFGPLTPNIGQDMATAFRRIWGNFVVNDNPSITNQIANGASSPNPNVANPAANFPKWALVNPTQINLNQTGGVPYTSQVFGVPVPVVQYMQPGLRNDIKAANAYTWEGGRGQRCDFWRTMSPSVPQ